MDEKLPRLLTLSDLDRVVHIQSTAFLNDPLWVYLFPDERRRWRPLNKCFTAFFRFAILNGQAYGVGEPLQGVAVWRAPNDRTRIAAILGAGFQNLLLSTFAVQFIRAGKVFSKFSSMQQRYAPDPHYYLETISVLPEAQGRGLASQLIRPFLQSADMMQVSTYTETMTPENVALYEHYGFKVMEAYAVPGTDLNIWAFHRPLPT